MLMELGEGFGDLRVLAVAGEVDIEDIFPVLAF
jgi:hypothetical protein